MTKKLNSLLAVLVVAALFFGVNFVFGEAVSPKRIDLTEEGLYTLSEGTENILGSLQDDLKLRFYFSEGVAAEADGAQTARSYAQRVEELLERYASLSKGHITLEIKDPEPFSETEDEAVGYGLRGARVPGGRDKLYFGLAGTNSTDGEEVIAFFDPQRESFLEHDLTKLVYALDHPERPRVGVFSSLPIRAQPGNQMVQQSGRPAWMIVDQLQNSFDVEWVERGDTSLPSDIDILVLIHPQNFGDSLLYAIDQFVLGGGRLIVYYDPFCESDTDEINPQDQMSYISADRASDLGPLLEAWGVQMDPEQLAADRENAMQVGWQGEGIDYVAIFSIKPDGMDSTDPAVSELKEVIMHTAGVLEPTADATTTFTPLLQTSEDSMRIERVSIAMSPNPPALLDAFVPDGKPLTVAARIGGPTRSAYPDGPPELEEGETAPELVTAHKDGAPRISVLMVADADHLQDQMWVQIRNILGQRIASPVSDNANLLLAALDNFAGNDDLISLRSRGLSRRPFTKVEKLQEAAEAEFRQEKQELDARLDEIQARIDELQKEKQGAVSGMIVTPEQRQAIDDARAEQLETRKKLRNVQRQLDKDIDKLEVEVKAWNFALPALIALLALGVWAFRKAN
ncbi:MAG: Gldg family protein [Planctomycetes bacterium]|nr:Gldg family protein [Planctomycetota bacterium]